MSNEITVKPIAYIKTDFKEKFGIPRQSGRIESAVGKIVFEPKYRDEQAIRGIEKFSHLWLIFDFSMSHTETFSPTVRPPRLGGNTRVGVFASRSPFRPNPIGLSSVKFLSTEKTENDGTVILVSGIDLLDNTPILDIKPYIPYADCHIDAVGSFADEHCGDKLEVESDCELLSILGDNERKTLIGCLSDDPRPAYQNDEDRIYNMLFADFDISFKVKNNKVIVTAIEPALKK